MATDSIHQQAHVIAKDLLIAAMESKDGIALETDPEKAAQELVAAFKILVQGVKDGMKIRAT